MLEHIELTNFKAHRHTALDLKPISIFIGPNNSGKSSIFQALQLLRQHTKQRLEAILIPSKPHRVEVRHGGENPIPFFYPQLGIDIGNFDDIVRTGSEIITIGFSGEILPENHQLMKYTGIIRIDYELMFKENRILMQKGSAESDKFHLNWMWDRRTEGQPNISKGTLGENVEFSIQPRQEVLNPFYTESWEIKNDLDKEKMLILQDLRHYLDRIIEATLKTFHFIYGIRGLEEKSYYMLQISPDSLEYPVLSDRNLALVNMFPYNRELEDQVSEWFKRMLNLKVRFEMKPGKVILQTSKSKLHRSLIGEGLGSQQLLSMLVPIALTREGDTIFIEEPEAHLHPKAQSDLVEFFNKARVDKNLQFIIATHSEHILLKFLNLVAKKDISKGELGIYSFRNKNDEIKVEELVINERGMVKGGLPGFFDESITLMEEFLTAVDENPEE